jgi:arginine/ornithine transport system substrate-binding protein
LFAVCLGVMIILAGTGTGFAADQLVIATEGAYPPFNYIDPDGNIKGFDVEIADALCKQMGMDYKLVVQEWDGMIPGLLAKKYDVIVASMSITEKRKKAVNFTGHYYRVPARFVARKGAGIDISKTGLKGKKVGVQRASTYANYLDGVYKDIVEVAYYDKVENHNLDLLSSRLDVVLAQAIFMSKWLELPEAKDYEFIGEPVWDREYIGEGAGIAVRKQDEQLQKKLNDALNAIVANGTHKRIADKYFAFDVYGYE